MELQHFYINQKAVALFIPQNVSQVTSHYSPYWAKVWPASIGLCCFLENNLHYILNKKVLELAAGLGLPSIFAAGYAKEVFASDIEPAAIAYIQHSARHHQLQNVKAAIIDWNEPLKIETPDVLLLSDVNYSPASFPVLFDTICSFLEAGATIILSTPQRLMAKEFITRLLPFTIQQDEVITELGVAISIFVYSKK
jgi:predicted nicotinamide N-methyase